MGFFDFLKRGNRMEINEAIANMEKDSVLLDVREPGEYSSGHIPGSRNVPVSQILTLSSIVSDKDTKVYVYCLSGARSSRAQRILGKQGYTNIINIGGIRDYRGSLECSNQG